MQWIDDQLDLYRLATLLGDSVWQHQIIERLRNKEDHIQREVQYLAWERLWIRFDEINRKILVIYEELRSSDNDSQKEMLREQAWELRNLRVQIGRKLRESQTGISKVPQRG